MVCPDLNYVRRRDGREPAVPVKKLGKTLLDQWSPETRCALMFQTALFNQRKEKNMHRINQIKRNALMHLYYDRKVYNTKIQPFMQVCYISI